MNASMDISSRIERADISLFSIESQTSENDRRSLLRLQDLVASNAAEGEYSYLEVGSHLGGSILPHLLDRRCRAIVSIDPRPASQPDERGQIYHYEENSSARMVAMLEGEAPDQISKLRTIDATSSDVSSADCGRGFRLALIDGEHTNRAAFTDFVNVLQLVEDNAIIAFHDANLVIDALFNVETMMKARGFRAHLVFLPDQIAAVALGTFADLVRERLSEWMIDPERAYAEAKREIVLVHQALAR
jgi:AcrR family transcriptional regulator